MADESSEKTEQPTQKKIEDAREKGQVAQSKDITNITAVVVLLGIFAIISHRLFGTIFGNYQIGFDLIQHNNDIKFYKIVEVLFEVLKSIMNILILPIVIAGVVSMLVNVIQINGIVLNKEFLKFDMNRLNPVSNFKNIYGMKNFIKFIRMIIEVIAIAIVVFIMVKGELRSILLIYQYSIGDIMLYIGLLLGKILATVFLMILVFGVIDYILEKRNMTKQLMMSHSEIKQEYKNSEGDPEVKHRRKELHRELLEDDVESGVANASLVLANPTHIAVVIIYQPQRFKLPVVIIKAKGEKAQQIFNYARAHDVLIVRDIWLARQLYAIAEVGKFIPQSLLGHIADVIGRNLHLLPKLKEEMRLANTPKPEVVKKPPGLMQMQS